MSKRTNDKTKRERRNNNNYERCSKGKTNHFFRVFFFGCAVLCAHSQAFGRMIFFFFFFFSFVLLYCFNYISSFYLLFLCSFICLLYFYFQKNNVCLCRSCCRLRALSCAIGRRNQTGACAWLARR